MILYNNNMKKRIVQKGTCNVVRHAQFNSSNGAIILQLTYAPKSLSVRASVLVCGEIGVIFK